MMAVEAVIGTDYGVSFHYVIGDEKTSIYRYVYDDEDMDESAKTAHNGNRYLAYFSIRNLIQKINKLAINLVMKPNTIIELEKLTGSVASHHHMELGSWHLMYNGISIISNPIDYGEWGAFEVWLNDEDEPQHDVSYADVIAYIKK